MVGSLFLNAFRPLDQYFVGALGKEAQGAIGAVAFVSLVAHGGALLFSGGSGPLVARATGAGDLRTRREVLGAALTSATLYSLLLAVVGVFGAEAVIDLLGLEEGLRVHAVGYLQVLFGAGFALSLAPTVDANFQAMGDARTPMYLQGLSVALNAILTPMLIIGAGMGTAGAALGTVLAQTLATGIGVALLWRKVGIVPVELYASTLRQFGSVFALGLPMAAWIATFAGVYWAVLALAISPLGPVANATLGIGFGVLESLAWPFFYGGLVAVSSVVGRRLGAGEPQEAWRAVRMMTPVTLGVGLAVGAVFVLAGPSFGAWFARDPAVVEGVAVYALVIGLSQPFVAVEALGEGVLSGSGHTQAVLWASLPVNLLRIPLAWWSAKHWGAVGVWWVISGTNVAKAIIKSALVWRGRWTSPPRRSKRSSPPLEGDPPKTRITLAARASHGPAPTGTTSAQSPLLPRGHDIGDANGPPTRWFARRSTASATA